jgi:DNA-binding SARP family transcriptional activator
MRYVPSKLTVPEKMQHIVRRPRIVRRLQSRKADLVLLIAPAGYGKTVLALQLLDQVAPPRRAWLDLDSRDDDPRRFAAYFVEALAQAVPDLRRTRIQDAILAGKMDLAQAAEELCFFLQECRQAAAWMVLDNWEHADATAEIRRFVTTLATSAKGRIKLIVNSRVAPSFGIRRLQERGIAAVVDRKELAFTFLEFRDAAIRRLGARASEEQLEEIWRLTEGWCVHLGLVLEVLGHRESPRFTLRRGEELESLIGYVEEELLPGIPPDLLDFLIRCAPLEVLSPAACAVLIPDEASVGRSLKALAASSIPSFPLAAQGAIRLHPLLREATARILRDRLDAEEVRALYHRAATYQIEQGLVLEGIRLLIDARDHGAALDAIHTHWFRIVEAGGQGRAQRWLESLPQGFETDPRYVTVMTNILSLQGDNRRLLHFLADKITPAAFPGDEPALANAWMHYFWAWLHDSDEPRYDAVTESWKTIAHSRGPFKPIVLAGVENILGYASLLQLDFERAEKHYQRSLELQGDASFDYAITTRNNIALCRYMRGDATGALADLQSCAGECVDRSAPSMLPMVRINLAEVCHAAGRLDEALESIDRCLETMRIHDIRHPFIDMSVEKIRGLCAWYRGRKEEAWGHLDAALQGAIRCGPVDALGVGILVDYLSTLDGRPRPDLADQGVPPPGHRSENRLAHAAREAWRAMTEGTGDRGGSLILELLGTAGATQCRPWLVTGHLLASSRADAMGNAESCKRELEEALSILEEIGWSNYPMTNPILTSFAYARSVRWNVRPGVARRLVGATQILERSVAFDRELSRPDGSPLEATRLLAAAAKDAIRGLGEHASRYAEGPDSELAGAARAYLEMMRFEPLPPLHIRMLGSFAVTAGGMSVVFLRRKSRLLFQMLLTEHPSPVHEEVILETLWPEADAKSGRAALHSAVKDLRQALDPHHEPRGRSYIEYEDGHYSLHLPPGSACDAYRFVDEIKRALALTAGKVDLSVGDEKLLQAALGLFGGELLPEQRLEAFAQELRERLHRWFLDATLRLVRNLNTRGRHIEAARALELGLAVDPLWGEGVQEMMLARAGNGELCRALRLYREYERRLRKELNLAPDPEMQRAFDSLLSPPLTA